MLKKNILAFSGSIPNRNNAQPQKIVGARNAKGKAVFAFV
jgi:hypothetical protein